MLVVVKPSRRGRCRSEGPPLTEGGGASGAPDRGGGRASCAGGIRVILVPREGYYVQV